MFDFFRFFISVLGKLHARFRRVATVLSLCFFSWCELKSKYLSVCVGFLYTLMVILPFFSGDEGVQQSDLTIANRFDGKGDLRVDGIQSVVEG